MKKGLFLILMCLFSISSFADNQCNFILNPDGTYSTIDGKDYIVIQEDTAKAETLYKMVKGNIMKMFKDPDLVMSESPYSSIKVRYVSDMICPMKSSLTSFFDGQWEGYVNFLFEFKDGAIKVSAPIVEDDVWDSVGHYFFSSLIKKFFHKGKRTTNKKKAARLGFMEDNMNNTINELLKLQKSDEW